MALNLKKNERVYFIQYIVTLVLTLVCLIVASLYSFFSFSDMAKMEAIRSGENSVQKDAKAINNFLLKNKGVLEVSSLIIDDVVRSEATNQDVRNQIVWVTEKFGKLTDDSSSSSLYGYVRGEFMDGVEWLPPDDFAVTKRPWYQEAFKARGEVALTAPYVDARTSKRMISLSRRLSDKKGVVAMDIDLSSILEKTELSKNDEEGFWMIMDKNGVVVSHSDSSQWGRNYLDSTYWETEKEVLARKILLSNRDTFNIRLGGKNYIAFSDMVLDSWFLVKLADETYFFERVRWILVRSIMLSLLIFLVVAVFCTTSFRNRIKSIRASKAKSIFLANMSHEIRTPINGILGMNSIIMKDVKDKNLREYAVNVQNAGMSLLSIVNDILDISKIESGRMILKSSSYDLFNVLSDCFNIASPKASAKNLRFSLDCDPDIPSGLWGDEVRVRQIINNLLSNAIKYTEYGDISLQVNYTPVVSKEPLSANNSVILNIVVKDTGVGIRPEDLPDIFGSFQRVNQKKNRDVEGIGLGLNLTKQLVEMNGGRISVRSQYGEGSTFMVSIPQIVLNAEPIGDFSIRYRQQVSSNNEQVENIFAPNARILVVDDINLNLKVFRGLLRETKAKVDTAMNGAQCLDMVKSKHYDLIFLDHMMPVMDGLETFERMKALGVNSLNANTPVIMLTANAVVGAKESYMKSGFTDYLSKPVREWDLIRTMMRYLPESLILTSDDVIDKNGTVSSWTLHKSSKQKPAGISEAVTIAPEKPAEASFANDPVPAKPKNRLEQLESIVDVKLGLEYCTNDEEFYFEMLQEYVDGDKLASIEDMFRQSDWKNYQILVHALKSTSLTIGAKELSEGAKSLEFACKESRFEFVQENHRRIMSMYSEMLKSVKAVLEVK